MTETEKARFDLVEELKKAGFRVMKWPLTLPETHPHSHASSDWTEKTEREFLELVKELHPEVVFHFDRAELYRNGQKVDTEHVWFVHEGIPFSIRAVYE